MKDTNALGSEIDDKIKPLGERLVDKDREHHKYELLDRFLESISREMLSGEEQKSAINTLGEIYSAGGDKFRHKYSRITVSLLKISRNNPTAREIIIDNLNTIISECIKDDSCNFKENLDKLMDHVNLEHIRLKNVLNMEDSIKELKNFQEKFKDFQKNFDGVKDEVQSLRKEHTTTLGVFAAIVIGFVGAFSFNSAMFAGLNGVSLEKLMIVASIGALFVGNVLFLLFEMIREINDKKSVGFPKRLIISFNLFFLVLLIVFIFALIKQ